MVPPKGSRPLHGACYGNKPEALSYLLRAGAHPNVADDSGCTPLMAASCRGDERASMALGQALMEAGADPNMEDNAGKLALHWAAMSGHVGMMNALS